MPNLKQPATIALINQILGFVLTSMAILIGNTVFSTTSTVLTLVLGTGTIAAFLSWRGRQPWWWVPIHLVFPIALLMASVMQIPAIWYLTGFIACALLFGTIHTTRVPYYPSRKPVWEALSKEMTIFAGNAKFIDIGCGMGGCALYLHKKHPAWTVSGIEIALLPWLICRLRSAGKVNPAWHYGSYQKITLADYDVIFAYLSPAAMAGLEQQLARDLQPEALFVSLEFTLPNWEIQKEVETTAGTLYFYRTQ